MSRRAEGRRGRGWLPPSSSSDNDKVTGGPRRTGYKGHEGRRIDGDAGHGGRNQALLRMRREAGLED